MRYPGWLRPTLMLLAFVSLVLTIVIGAVSAEPSFSQTNVPINIPQMFLTVNITVPANNPTTGTFGIVSENITVPIAAMQFNITIPASVPLGVYNALNNSLNQSVLQAAIASSLNSSLPGAINGSGTNETGRNLTAALVTPLSESIASSLAYSLPLSIASILPQAIGPSLSAGISSSLYTGLPVVLSQALSSSLSTVLPVVSQGAVNYTNSLLNAQTGGASYYVQSAPTPQEVASYIATAVQNNLTSTMTPVLESELTSTIYSDLQQSLQGGIASSLSSYGLQENITKTVNQSLSGQLSSRLSPALQSSLSHNAITTISANISAGIASSLAQQLSANLAQQFSSQLAQSLAAQLSQNLGSGIATYASQGIASGINSSLQKSLPSYFSSSSPNQNGASSYLEFGTNVGTVPVPGVPMLKEAGGTYVSESISIQEMNAGQVGYILLTKMSPALNGQTSVVVGTAVQLATVGLTPYSEYQAIESVLPAVLPNALASSISYALGNELNGGLSASGVLTAIGIGTGIGQISEAGGLLSQLQAGTANVGSVVTAIGSMMGSQAVVAAGSLLSSYQLGTSLPGLVTQLGAVTGSQSLLDAGVLLGEWQNNASIGTFASTIGALTGSQGLVTAGQVATLLGQKGESVGNFVSAVGAISGSQNIVNAGYALGALQNDQSLGNLLQVAGALAGSSNIQTAGAVLNLAQNGGSVGGMTEALGAIMGSSTLVNAGVALSAIQSGATAGSALSLVGSLTGSKSLSNAGLMLNALGYGGAAGGLSALGAITGSSGLTTAGEYLGAVQNGGTIPGLLNNLASVSGSPYLYGAALGAGLLANGGTIGSLLSLQAAGNGAGGATALFNIASLPGGISATAAIPAGQLIPSSYGLNGGYSTAIGGVVPFSILGSVNFILPSLPSSAESLSGLFPGLPGIGVPSGLSSFLNQDLPGLPSLSGLNPFLGGLNIPPIAGTGGLIQGLGLPALSGLGLPGLQNLLGPIPNLQGLLGNIPGLSALSLPNIPGLDLSGFSIPGLGEIPTGFSYTLGGSYGALAGKLGINVGLNGVTLNTNLNVDLSNAFSELGVSQSMVNELGAAAGYASLALQAYSVVESLGSSSVTEPIPVVIVSTPFPVNQISGSSVILPGANAVVTEGKSPFFPAGATGRSSLPQFQAAQSGDAGGAVTGSSGGALAGAGQVVAAGGSQGGQGGQGVTTSFNLIPQTQTLTVSSPYTLSPTSQIAQYNEQHAPWFLTCPTAPVNNPTNDILFDANKQMSVGGNACLAGGGTLTTVVTLSTKVHTQSPCAAPVPLPSLMKSCDYSQVQPLVVVNPGALSLQMITYSPEVDGELSNGFSTDSYIFQGVPSSAQHAIWSWNAEIANFANAKGTVGPYSKQALIVTLGPGCTYLYSYTEKTELVSMSNNYIPFTEITNPSEVPAASLTTPPLGSPGSALKANIINSNVIPLLLFNYSLGMSSVLQSSNPNLSHVSEDIYSPWNYYTPYNSIDEFPINLPGVFLSNNAAQVLSATTENGLGIDTASVQMSPVVSFSITTGLGAAANAIASAAAACTGSTAQGTQQVEQIGGQSECCVLSTDGSTSCIPLVSSAAAPAASLGTAATCQSGGGTVTQNGGQSECCSTSPSGGYACVPISSAGQSPAAGAGNGGAAGAAAGTCPSSGGGVLSASQALACADAAGFANTGKTPQTLGLDTVVAISEAESSLNTQAVHDNGVKCTSGANAGQESLDVGVMQINNCAHPDMVTCSGLAFSSCSGSATNPASAYQDAYQLSSGGSNFNPWCTYGPSACGGNGNSAYCQYMPTGDPCATAGSSGAGLIASGLGGTTSFLSQVNVLTIQNPISIASSGNDYIYVLYKNPSQNNNYDIAIVRVYPKGYYNATSVPVPPIGTSNVQCSSDSGCMGAWDSTWSNYWNNVIKEQSYEAYVVNVISFSTLYNSATGSSVNAAPQIETPVTVSSAGSSSSAASCSAASPVDSGILDTCSTINPSQNTGAYGSGHDFCQPAGACQVVALPGSQGQCSQLGSSGAATTSSKWECVPTSSQGVSLTISNPSLSYGQSTPISGTCTPSGAECVLSSPALGISTSSVSGAVSYSFSVPTNLAPGPYTVTLTSGTASVSATITVTSGACANIGGSACSFTPYNISADSGGDIFVVGSAMTPKGQGAVELVKVSNVIVGGGLCAGLEAICNKVSFNAVTLPGAGSVPKFTEIAASPQLGNVYVASPNFGGVAVFNGASLQYLDTITLAYAKYPPAAVLTTASGTPATPGLLGNSAASPIAALNIASWMQNGGLFGYKIPGVTPSATAGSSSSDLDSPSNHHPLALADVNGYLYVLDEWSGSLNGGANFNILTLRAVNSTGSDVPINPTFFNDMYGQNTCSVAGAALSSGTCYTSPPPSSACNAGCVPSPILSAPCGGTVPGGASGAIAAADGYQYTCVSSAYSQSPTYYSISTPSQFFSNAYPPYGWIISATVGSTSFCGDGASGCVQPAGPTFAVGPKLSQTSPCGTLASAALGYFTGCGGGISMSVNENGTLALFMPGANTNFDTGELLFARFGSENYTKPAQGVPPFVCYTAQGGGLCGKDSAVSGMMPPVYAVEDPFKYLENVGSQKIFSYANQYYSEFTGGAGTVQSVSGLSSSCLNQIQNLQAPTNCGGGTTPSGISISSLLGSAQPSNALQPGSAPANVPVLTSSVGGSALIGYKHIYTLKQTWGPFTLLPHASPYYCIPASYLPAVSDSSSKTVYSYAVIPPTHSAPLSANVEGGGTYLQYAGTQNYYMQNLSDAGLYLSQHILFNETGDRAFGSVYVADAGQGNAYQILNATEQLNYVIESFSRASLQYQTILSENVGPYYGPQYSIAKVGAAGVPANFIFSQAQSLPPHFGSVILFDWYKEEVYDSQLNLYIPKTTGYQRIMYAFNDKFNNTIFAPIDADIAHTTTLSTNITGTVNPGNSNQTTITISGAVGENTYNGFDIANSFFVPLPDANVFLYYGQDINYVDSSGNPLSVQQAQLCAFGSQAYMPTGQTFPSACNLANPMWTGLQGGASKVNYATGYQTPGSCAPPPNSLLYPVTLSCNIYGYNSLPTACPAGSGGMQRYCYPIYENGSGTCTSQLGLIGVATTNKTGQFTFNTVVCGIGEAKISASYYGDTLQPITVTQEPLTQSANGLVGPDPPGSAFKAVSYMWQPGGVTGLTSVGLFELGFGGIDALGLIVVVAVALLVLFRMRIIKIKKGNAGRKRR